MTDDGSRQIIYTANNVYIFNHLSDGSLVLNQTISSSGVAYRTNSNGNNTPIVFPVKGNYLMIQTSSAREIYLHNSTAYASLTSLSSQYFGSVAHDFVYSEMNDFHIRASVSGFIATSFKYRYADGS